MIRQEKPEAVIACVGPELHYEAARFCLDRGIPIYTEKPPAARADQVEALVQLAEKNQTLGMTGFKKRYSDCYLRADKWLRTFDVADWECFSVDWYAGPFDLTRNPRETVLLDFGIHAIDLVTWLFGPAEKVTAFSRNWHSFAVILKMVSGIIGTLTFSDQRSFEHPGEEAEITIAGGHAMSIHNSTSWRIQQEGRPVEWYEPPTCLAAGDSGYNTGMLRELEVFAGLVRRGEAPTDNLKTSQHTMRLYEAVTTSLGQGGQTVML